MADSESRITKLHAFAGFSWLAMKEGLKAYYGGLTAAGAIAGATAWKCGEWLFDLPAWVAVPIGVGVGWTVFAAGAYRLWADSAISLEQERKKVALYEAETPLQQGIANALKRGKELRARLLAARDDRHVAFVMDKIIEWSGDVSELIFQQGGSDLWEVHGAAIDGIPPPLNRENVLGYLDRSLLSLKDLQTMLQEGA